MDMDVTLQVTVLISLLADWFQQSKIGLVSLIVLIMIPDVWLIRDAWTCSRAVKPADLCWLLGAGSGC